MVAVTLVIALVVSLAALAWVIWPLLDRSPALPLVEDDRLGTLIARKESVMTAIKDLEFDYNVGKLDDEDYQRYDQRLRRQAIGLIQQIETIAPQSTGLDVKVENEIAQRRKVIAPNSVPAAYAAPQTVALGQPAAPRPQPTNGGATVALPTAVPAGAAGATRFCTNCGSTIQPQHKFCANCGTPVSA